MRKLFFLEISPKEWETVSNSSVKQTKVQDTVIFIIVRATFFKEQRNENEKPTQKNPYK